MKERLLYIAGQLQEAWGLMPLGQRFTISLLVAAMMGSILLFGAWSRSPEYEAAFAGLSEEEAAKIVSHLRDNNIPYQLSANGRAISVPRDKLAEVRLQLAEAGLANKGQAGFELFDQPSFGMTEQMQRINYQRALEGEITRTIKRMEGVEDARVHVVLSTNSLFADKKSPASASVVLNLKTSRQMEDDRVQAILNLVAGSVEGLKPENISIIDTKGRILNNYGAPGSSGGAKAVSAQYQQQRRYEADLVASLTSALERVVGPGNAAVRVAADFNWDQVETQRESVDTPTGSTGVRSQRAQSEVSTSIGTSNTGGVPGTTSNVPTYQATTGESGKVGYERKDTLTNYELGKIVERTVKAPGVLKRVSVMVMVDENNLPGEVTAESLEKLVTAAANLNLSQGDSVVVSKIPFSTKHAEEEIKALEKARQWELMINVGRYVGLVLVPIVLLLLLRVFLRRSLPAVPQLPSGRQGVRVLRQELPVPEPAQLEDTRMRMAREQLVSLAEKEPEMVSALINNWLEEGRQ